MAEEQPVGKVTHYYNHLGVAIVELTGPLKLGDQLHFKGHGQDFEQAVDSMQVEHQEITEAKAGDIIGLKVSMEVKEGTPVFLMA